MDSGPFSCSVQSNAALLVVFWCVCVCEPSEEIKTSNLMEFWFSFPIFVFINFQLPGGNLMFAADCPMKRAAFMTDMALGRWSHVPAFSTSFLAELRLP